MNSSTDTPRESAASSEREALKLWIVLARAYASIEAAAAKHAMEHGLSLSEFGTLEMLHHKGPLLLGEVQRRLLVSSGGVTYLVDRLTERGLVERQACPDDRRARYAALTPAGEELIATIFPEHARRIQSAVAGLSWEEKRRATMLLRKLGMYAEQADISDED